MKKIIVLISIFCVSASLTGCNITVQTGASSQDQIAKENTKETKDTKDTQNAGLETIEKDIDSLVIELSNSSDENDIQIILKDFAEKSNLEFSAVYYGDVNGEFWIYPEATLPDDYSFVDRPPYKFAAEQGMYAPEVYMDMVTNRKIQTVSKPVIVKDKLLGVVGVDVFVN